MMEAYVPLLEAEINYTLTFERYCGVIVQSSDDNLLTVIAVTGRSPAKRFGVKAGDRIVGVNGNNNPTLGDVVNSVSQGNATIMFTRNCNNHTRQ